MKKIVSFSGGKDSTAMLLKLIEKNFQIDEIIFFDTGWEFPEIIHHVKLVQNLIKLPITILKPRQSFNYIMVDRPIKKKSGPAAGIIYRYGLGWPSPFRRWCTREKVNTINRYCKLKYGNNYQFYIGYAFDEIKRIKPDEKNLYPLLDLGMTEKDCLEYCYSYSLTWGNLYDYFSRVSCYCCPLQKINDYRQIRFSKPDLWKIMLKLDKSINNNRGFVKYKTVQDLEKRFHNESLQMELFEN